MSQYNRITITEIGEVCVVGFVDRRLLDEALIQELGAELFGLIEREHRQNILLTFANVEYLSGALLGKLITLDKKVKATGARLRLTCIRPNIMEVFVITKLSQLFNFTENEAAALASF